MRMRRTAATAPAISAGAGTSRVFAITSRARAAGIACAGAGVKIIPATDAKQLIGIPRALNLIPRTTR